LQELKSFAGELVIVECMFEQAAESGRMSPFAVHKAGAAMETFSAVSIIRYSV